MRTSEQQSRTSGSPTDPVVAGSAWWVEVLFGTVCCLIAAAFGLALTSVGPFGTVAVAYPSVVAVAYLVGTASLGATFLRSGVRKSRLVADAGPDGQYGDAAPVAGKETDV